MADTCTWVKIYQNNTNGSSFTGNLSDLVKAVKAGAEVQIRYFRPSGIPELATVEWHRLCSSVTIAENENAGVAIVSCAFTDIPDTKLSATAGRTFIGGENPQQPFAFEWQIFNTTGRRHRVEFNRQTLAVGDNEIDSLGIAWYVRGYDRDAWWRNAIRTFVGIRTEGLRG